MPRRPTARRAAPAVDEEPRARDGEDGVAWTTIVAMGGGVMHAPPGLYSVSDSQRTRIEHIRGCVITTLRPAAGVALLVRQLGPERAPARALSALERARERPVPREVTEPCRLAVGDTRSLSADIHVSVLKSSYDRVYL